MMTVEKHLAAILTAWGETDGYGISVELDEALTLAAKDFDGVEDDGLPAETQRQVWPGAKPRASLKVMINGEWLEMDGYFRPGYEMVTLGPPSLIKVVDDETLF